MRLPRRRAPRNDRAGNNSNPPNPLSKGGYSFPRKDLKMLLIGLEYDILTAMLFWLFNRGSPV